MTLKEEYDNFLKTCIIKLQIKDKKGFINSMDDLLLSEMNKSSNELVLPLSSILGKYSTIENTSETMEKEIDLLNSYIDIKKKRKS